MCSWHSSTLKHNFQYFILPCHFFSSVIGMCIASEKLAHYNIFARLIIVINMPSCMCYNSLKVKFIVLQCNGLE